MRYHRWYGRRMAVNMHLRDVPDEVHEELQRRAESAGMTLRQYTLKVLGEHCATMPLDEWTARLARVRARRLTKGDLPHVDAAALVNDAREADAHRSTAV